MPQIKRYPNRKLYDTDAKRYVTLDSIAELIQAGKDVQVVDHESGEDLTNLTLTQIILEQEKKSDADFLPRALLTSLIRAGGDRLEQVRRSLQTSIGSTSVASLHSETVHLEEQIAKMLEQSRLSTEQALKLDERMADILRLLNLPSQRDIGDLQARLDALNQQLDSLASLNEEDGLPPQPTDAVDEDQPRL